jgi:sec-independent protein translocase protein TatB
MELMVIVIVALIVIGPKDLPAALRTMGRSLRTVRRMSGEFQSQVDQFIRNSEIETMRREVEDAIQDEWKASPKAKVEPVDQAAAHLPSTKSEPGPQPEGASGQDGARTRNVS